MIKKEIGKDFGLNLNDKSLSLYISDVVNENDPKYKDGIPYRVELTKLNKSGWTITAEVCCDYYEWVDDFKASHPDYGVVYGSIDCIVFASSEEAFSHFWKHHEPFSWDSNDI